MEQEIVEEPDPAQLATVEHPGKTETKNTIKKKKPLNWPLFLFGAGGVLWYFWDKKKKAQAQAQTYKDRLLPPVKREIEHVETSGSAESRLNAMGEGYKGSNPTARQEHKEI